MDYAIDVTRIPIRLKTLNGEHVDVTVFVHSVGHADYRPESVGDRLNDPDTQFLPCEIDGQSHLVSLSSISYAVMTEPVPEVQSLETVGATQEQVVEREQDVREIKPLVAVDVEKDEIASVLSVAARTVLARH